MKRRGRSRRLTRWVVPPVAVVAGVGVLAGVRLSTAAPEPTVTPAVAPVRVAGRPPRLPWPKSGQAALSIPALGTAVRSGPELPVPIASLAKVMMAYIVLRDHPLGPNQSGPLITMTPVDTAEYDQMVAKDESSLPVAVGEQLSERQLLEGALLPSAGNYADALARFDAGSVGAFVAKMNATAAALGMRATRYVDVSGYKPGTVSTASDQLVIATRAMAEPAFATIVDMAKVTLPLAGTVSSYTPLVGNGTVVGVKTGFTDQAGGCDMLAATEPVAGGGHVRVLAVVTGVKSQDVLPAAGYEALTLARAAATAVRRVRVVRAGERVATVTLGHGQAPATVAGGASVLAWPATSVALRLIGRAGLRPGAPSGALVGRLVVRAGEQHRALGVHLAGQLPGNSLFERLF